MAAFSFTSACSLATVAATPKVRAGSVSQYRVNFSLVGSPLFSGLKQIPRIQFSKDINKFSTRSRCFKSTVISCSIAKPETLEIVQNTIAKQLSIDASAVAPETKFADLGADSLDTVEIMMALEEQFGVSIGESGAENIATVQDAADLIEKLKTPAA